MKAKKYTTVAEVAQAIGLNAYGQRLLQYLDQYFPDLAIDYEYIMSKAQSAAEAAEEYVRVHGTDPIHQMGASEVANEVLMAGLHFSKFDEIFSVVAEIIYEEEADISDYEARKLSLQWLPKFESIFAKYPTDNKDFTAEVAYDEMKEKLTVKARKLLAPEIEKVKESLPF